MPFLDATAKAALANPVVAPAFYIFIDYVGDPVRVTTYGADVAFAATGDADLDGFTFSSVDPTVLSVGDVSNSEGGSDTVTISLSGIVGVDTALLTAIGNTASWRGRTCRLWLQIYDETGASQGAIAPYYTGYMSSIDIMPTPESQTIQLKVENYLALLAQPSNRTYMSQKEFDSTDTSGSATLAAATGAQSAGPGRTGGGGGSTAFNKDPPGLVNVRNV